MKTMVITFHAVGVVEGKEAFERPGDSGCHYREEMFCRQQERINHGIATGRITLDQAICLQNRLNRMD